MDSKQKYVEKFKKLYKQKNSVELSDDLALEYFEKLTTLVSTITSHIPVDQIIITSNGK